ETAVLSPKFHWKTGLSTQPDGDAEAANGTATFTCPAPGTVAVQFNEQLCAANPPFAAAYDRAAIQYIPAPSSAIPLASAMRTISEPGWGDFRGRFITDLLCILICNQCFMRRLGRDTPLTNVFPEEQIAARQLLVNSESGWPLDGAGA